MELLIALAALVVAALAWRQSSRALAELQGLRGLLARTPGDPAPRASAPAPYAPGPMLEPLPGPVPALVPPPLPATAGVPETPPAAPPPLPQRIDIERLLTQRWGTWLGAVAILLAGVFLVRTAAERGWMGPAPRCLAGFALGLVLVLAAVWLRRRPSGPAAVADNAPAALAAGGVAVLFAAAYGAGPLYGLLPGAAGFALMAAVSLAALALALAFGRLVGAVGVLMAFATPALVQTDDPSMPGLFAYLLLVSAACWSVVRLTAWTWLGWGAALFGAGWVLLALGEPDPWAAGLFVPAASALTVALLPSAALDHPAGRRFAWAPMLMLGLAGLALAAAAGDPLARAGVLLLAPVAMAKAWTEPRVAWLPMVSAGLAVGALLAWRLPAFRATGEAITVEGAVQAILPGPWAPEAILPFLQTAAAVAALHAVAGWVGERRTARPLPWAALLAGVPVLVLAAAYAQVGRFQPQTAWAASAAVLAAVLVGAAGLARPNVQRAGVHGAGVVAALALGCAILLDAAWLTVALALMLPALAWISRAAALPPLRHVAMVVACVVLVRLVLNPFLPGYPVGSTPILNMLLVAYGIPALCFAAAARVFGRRDDRLFDVLVAGACLFGLLLLLLEIRHWRHGAALWTADPDMDDAAWAVTLAGVYALILRELALRQPGPVLAAAWRMVGALALLGGVGLLLLNPWVTGEGGGQGNLLVAYLVPAVLAFAGLARGARPRPPLGGYAILALLVWSSCAVREAFHPGRTAFWQTDLEEAELWALSGAWSLLAAGVLAAGIALRQRALRLAGLALVGLVVAKVFLVDMAGIEGLWRVLSFLGLGLGLIGLGAAYRRFGARI